MSSANPIIVVTGANGGVGFGICQRLLLQLSSTQPSDALPQPELRFMTESYSELEAPISSVQGLTLIMACRSTKRAETARKQLYALVDNNLKKQKKLPGYAGHADTFRKNLRIEIHYLDLAIIQSVFRFGAELSQKYPYISHLICNAGVASFSGIEWPAALKQLAKEPINAVTAPLYYRQHQGEISADGLGWVWQCNVFGHYCLFRTLQPLLATSKSSLGARVIWTSSIEASPSFYDSEDWQLIKTAHSYESSKYQIDIISTHLDRRAIEETTQGSAVPVRHVVVQPGVASTNISNALIGSFLDILKVLTFYIARFFGSSHHPIQPFKSAIAAVHLSLISLSFIPSFTSITSGKDGSKKRYQPVRFGAETDQWGHEHVGLTPVRMWDEHAEEGLHLLEKCDGLYDEFWKTEGNN